MFNQDPSLVGVLPVSGESTGTLGVKAELVVITVGQQG
jgi:hypothetical protein